MKNIDYKFLAVREKAVDGQVMRSANASEYEVVDTRMSSLIGRNVFTGEIVEKCIYFSTKQQAEGWHE